MRRKYKDLRKYPRRIGKDVRVKKSTGISKMFEYLRRKI